MTEICHLCVEHLPGSCKHAPSRTPVLYFNAGVMGSKMSSNFFSSLKEAGANLLPDIWPNHTSPASSTTENNTGLDDLAVDSRSSVLQSLKDGDFGFTRGE